MSSMLIEAAQGTGRRAQGLIIKLNIQGARHRAQGAKTDNKTKYTRRKAQGAGRTVQDIICIFRF